MNLWPDRCVTREELLDRGFRMPAETPGENVGVSPPALLRETPVQTSLEGRVIDSLGFALCAVDADTYRVTLANRAACSAGLAPGITCHAFFRRSSTPCGSSPYPCPVDEAKHLRTPVSVRHLQDDGHSNPQTVDVHASPVVESDGVVRFVVLSSASFGWGAGADQALKRFEFIVNTAEEFMTLVNRDYVYEAVNRAYCRARNARAEDIVGRSVKDLWGQERFARELKGCFEECFSGKEVHHEAWFDFAHGGRGCFDVRYYPYRGGSGEVTHAVVVTHDITRRKLAEESLRHSEEKFSSAFHLCPESMAITTVHEGRFIDVNEAFLRLTGYGREEVIGRTSRELDLWCESPEDAEILDRIAGSGRVADREMRLRIRSGGMRTVLFSAECIRHGGELCVISVARDITERKQAEEGLRAEVRSLGEHLLNDRLEHEEAFAGILTRNPRMRSIFKYVEAVAASPQPVFITGDTGVGKELVAKVIHDLSGRKGPFVAVNVAGLDDAVFSDTLFGHRKGAFTGAEQHREGLLAQASGGTLFLDEIGDLRESSQVKLLRLLQDHTYYPLGADVPRRSDARVLVATNRGVQNVIAEGAFRKDLYYRLRTHHVHIPPLSERKEDIPLLLDHFVAEAARALNRRKPSLSPDLNIFLTAYNFPGNVRELHAMVFDAVARHKTGRLAAEDFKESLVPGDEVHSPPAPLPAAGEAGHLRSLFGRFPTLREAELLLISEALRQSGNNQGTAAALLGITRQALNKRLHRTPELSALRKT